MHALEILEKVWENKPDEAFSPYGWNILKLHKNADRDFEAWESRFVLMWQKSPKFAKEYMKSNTDTLVISSRVSADVTNSAYYLFGCFTGIMMDYRQDVEDYKWNSRQRPATRKYKEELDNLPKKKRQELFKRLLVDRTTNFLRYNLNIKTILLDVTFPKKTKDLQEVLSSYANGGWAVTGMKKIPGSDHLFMELSFNPYI